ncbi:TMV resistance protein N-like [Rosa chinensis]|uniref:TMV resistance protein N-like n=1 Tax=Rosa chinensis TaxID=74649 RepID=UPI000D08F8F9|nr:TMV resistance protein N-like [Rosa chinensis]XP_040363867.1 TMV resistance protein N-like [Rosa chinensis]XP_040363868.1 TMV resistance protein N-like [Rosa chinensis]XP_040363869.1 TMV resistance protein N-like [Rosa chinensis]
MCSLIITQGASSSSSSSSTISSEYDVFLSFRGEDTRHNFTDHLYNNLVQKGITTFIDDDLRRGEDISLALLKAIEQSRSSIIVISQNYASSTWCLDELVKILQCKESKQQMVWPIFYKVEPSDVRNQTGCFGEAFAYHECRFKNNMEKVLRWKKALREAANLSGWTLADRHEYKFIHDIVEVVSLQVVNCTYLNVAKYPVGIQSRLQDMNELLCVGETDIRMIGVWGTGGIGKTTIVKAVYNSIIHKFEGGCFLESVRERSIPYGGLVELQNCLLSTILGWKELKVTNVDSGISVIKQRLRHKRILLILDDVNQLNQLDKLVGERDWFGSGSRIIITTRDKHLLTAHHVHLIYKVKELDHHEALELFSWNAFTRNMPAYDYVELASTVVQYGQGLPLALIILGSHLCGRSTNQWQAALDSYKRVPNQEIQGIFKISYDELDVLVKEVFLDIACFFKGKDKSYVVQILEGCDLNPFYGIEVLAEKALLNIDNKNHIWMHDLLEEMGKDIVRQESPREPGERSRLWFEEDVHHVLTENTGTNKIKGIIVKLAEPYEIHLNAESFSKMKNLQIFINCNASFTGEVEYLPNELRFLDWPKCPLKSLPSNFNPRKLIKLNMPYSCMSQLGHGFKNLQNLKTMNLEGCKFLTKVVNFEGLPNLENLNLKYCTSLVEVDPSVGSLNKLVDLSLVGCYKLAMFPRRASWKSMQKINLQDCRSLKHFPEIVDKMEFLTFMILSGSGIRELPSSIGNLIGLEDLYLKGCENLTNLPCSIYELRHLEFVSFSECPKLVDFPIKVTPEVSWSAESFLPALPKLMLIELGGCSLAESEFLASLGCVSALLLLDLSRNSFVSLPACLSKFVNLRELNLSGCDRLREIPELPPKVELVNARGCVSLERFSQLSNILEHKELHTICRMDLSNCHRLYSTLAHDVAKKKSIIQNPVESFCSLFLTHHRSRLRFRFVFTGSEVPKCFHYRKDLKDIELSYKYSSPFGEDYPTCIASGMHKFFIPISKNLDWFNSGLAVCGAVEYTENISGTRHLTVEIRINDFEDTVSLHSTEIESDEMWLQYIPFSTFIDRYSWAHLWGHHDFVAPAVKYVYCRVSVDYSSTSSMRFKSFGVHLVTPYHDEYTTSEQEVLEDIGTSAAMRNEHNDYDNVGNIEDLEDVHFSYKDDEEHHSEPPANPRKRKTC